MKFKVDGVSNPRIENLLAYTSFLKFQHGKKLSLSEGI